MHGLYYLVLQPLIGGEGPAGRGCVLGSIGCARTGGADIAAYAGGMQGAGGGAASQSQGPVWLLGALGGRASVQAREGGGTALDISWALRGGAPARAGGGPRARTRTSGAPAPSRGKVLSHSTPRWWGHPGHRGGGGPWANPDTECACASTESGSQARAAPRLLCAHGAAVPTLEGERRRSGSRGERRARRTGGGARGRSAWPGCRDQLAVDAASRGRAC